MLEDQKDLQLKQEHIKTLSYLRESFNCYKNNP